MRERRALAPGPTLENMGYGDWAAPAEGVFYRRHESIDVNVGVVLGADGALLVDSRATPVQGREVAEALAAITELPVRWLINTHYHWDHTFGNQVFRDVEIWGHPACRRFLLEHGEEARAEAVSWEPELASQLGDLEIVPPEHLVEVQAVIDVGGRTVSIAHPGRAHTSSDLVVRVDDAPVVFAGDILESSGPPYFGDGFPVEWEKTVKEVVRPGDEAVVPGHGPMMTLDEVATQAEELESVAAMCRRAHVEGLRPEDVDLTGAPYPEETMREALARGLEELG